MVMAYTTISSSVWLERVLRRLLISARIKGLSCTRLLHRHARERSQKIDDLCRIAAKKYPHLFSFRVNFRSTDVYWRIFFFVLFYTFGVYNIVFASHPGYYFQSLLGLCVFYSDASDLSWKMETISPW